MQLILFDIDGTLLLPKGAGRASTQLAMREVFGAVGRLDQHHFGGKTDWLTLIELLGELGYDEARIGAAMPVYEAAIARYLSQIVDGFGIEACPGALEAVNALRGRDGVLLGVVTGNVASTAPIKLRAAGYDPAWFPVGAYGSESPDRNRLAALALERANTYAGQTLAPQDVVVVGDTVADIACARALGARAVAVETGFATRAALEAAAPDTILRDLTALPALLPTLATRSSNRP